MKTIKLKRTTINLPECWEDLKGDQVVFAFHELARLLTLEITPFQFQLNMLIKITGYKPAKKSGFWFRTKWFFRLAWLMIFRNERYKEIIQHRADTQEIIEFNLIQLAEHITFAFTLQDNKIVPNYDFKRNPFDSSAPVYFNRDVTVETNITAKQYVDCMDLLQAFNQTDKDYVRIICLRKIMETLYGFNTRAILRLPAEIPFGVMFWFTGIVKFFREHPVYSVLYDRAEGDEPDESKINLGMSETLLFLEKEGYSFVQDKNVIEFYDAQVKALKDSVNNALGSGITKDELAKRTGLSIKNINRLSND